MSQRCKDCKNLTIFVLYTANRKDPERILDCKAVVMTPKGFIYSPEVKHIYRFNKCRYFERKQNENNK